MPGFGHTLMRPGAAVLLQCRRMVRADPPWWMAPTDRAEWCALPGIQYRERLAAALASETARADQGATRQAHRDDVQRVAMMASYLRLDWTPAAVVAWLDGLDDGGEA